MPNIPLPPRRPSSKVGSDGPMPPKRIDIMDMQKAKKLREQNKNKAMGIPRDEARRMAEEARQMREADGDVIININNKKKDFNKGGYVCKPNPRKGNIDMRKKGMTRKVVNNLKYKKG